jgi:hypothetical protein
MLKLYIVREIPRNNPRASKSLEPPTSFIPFIDQEGCQNQIDFRSNPREAIPPFHPTKLSFPIDVAESPLTHDLKGKASFSVSPIILRITICCVPGT